MAYTARPRRRRRRHSYRPCGWADHVLSLFKRVIIFNNFRKYLKSFQNRRNCLKIITKWLDYSDGLIFFALKKYMRLISVLLLIRTKLWEVWNFVAQLFLKNAKMAPDHQNCNSACPRDWEQNSLLSLLSEAKSRPLEAGKLRDRAFVKLSFLGQLMHTTC